MKKKVQVLLCVTFAFCALAPCFARESRAAMAGIQITRDVPASEAASISKAGFDTVVIYYSPYRVADDAAIIGHLKQWGEKAKKLNLKLYVRIDTGPPLDAVADSKTLKYRAAASDDGYPLTHKPAPASEEFWRTAVFPKLDVLSRLSKTLPIKGVFINLDNHVEVSFDIETFSEFLKTKEPSTDPNAMDPRKRKPYLIEKGLLGDYEKFQEDRIYEFLGEYVRGMMSRTPKFEISLASYADNPLHRAFIRVLNEMQPASVTAMYTFHNSSDIENRPAAGLDWVPSLSVREFPPDELAAVLATQGLFKKGFLVSDAQNLWKSLKDIDINGWPLGLSGDYLAAVARVKKSGGKVPTELAELARRLAGRVAVNTSGAPKPALIYSGYHGYMFRDVFDAPLAATGIKLDKYENTKLDKLIPAIGSYDMVVTAPGYNAVKSDRFPKFAPDILNYVKNGGLLLILDASMPQQVDWLGDTAPELKLAVAQGKDLSQKWINSSFKMMGYPNLIKKLPPGKNHFVEAAPGWRKIAIDNEDKPYAVQRMYGQGMIVALADFSIDQDFIVNMWEYMLRIKDRFDVEPDSNMKPLVFGGNEIPFVATTFGGERKLKIKVQTLSAGRKSTAAERSVTLTNEGGARFTIPLDVKEAGLHRVTLTFFDTVRDRIDRRDSFAFLAPGPYETMLEKSYYTSEPEAVLRVACRRAGGCKTFTARVALDTNGKKIEGRQMSGAELSAAKGEFYFKIPISKLSPGEYKVSVSVGENSGVRILQSVQLRKLAPGLSVETKLLNFRGGQLEVNGKPYFPLGIYSIPPENLDELAQSGVNGMIYYGSTVKAESDKNAAVKGKGILFSAYPIIPHERFMSEDRKVLAEEVREKAKNENMFMWYLADEPEGFGQSPELIYDVYSFVKKIDPYRPQSIVMMTPSAYSRYEKAADVFMFDRYPTPTAPLDTVGIHARAAVRAVYGRKPVIAIPQAFSWAVWDGSYKEGSEHRPNPTEMRSSAIQSISAGVKGIIYWAFTASRYDMRKFPKHVEAFKGLMKELSGIIDVLAEPNAYVDISVSPDFQGIGWGAKKHEGKLYIFAFNGDNALRDIVTFKIPANLSGGKVDVYNENRSIDMDGREFTDSFDSYGSHIYVIPIARTKSED